MSGPVILGSGYCVPEKVRGNDAPIFDWLHAHPPPGPPLFAGYVERRVLADGEDLMDLMLPAARQAIAGAGLQPQDIDLLLGLASVSPYDNPNALSQLHLQLGLPERAWVLPLANDFTNFNAALWMADALVRAGRVRNVLIAVGGNWTRFVDYHTPQSVSAGDGAGAAVVGPARDGVPGWQVVDQATATQSGYYGTMYMRGQPVEQPPGAAPLWTSPTFHILPEGFAGFKAFGGVVPQRLALALLAQHAVPASQVTLISHQASSVLMDTWKAAIQPGRYVSTLESFANMTVATLPVTLAWAEQMSLLHTPWLLLLGLGGDMHANVLLLRRG